MTDPSASKTIDLFRADLPPAPLWRRLVAMIYDGLLLVAVWIGTAAILVTIYSNTGLPMEAVGNSDLVVPPSWFKQLIIGPIVVLETWGFYAWFWTHGGQTLGMRAWKLLSRDVHRRQMTLLQTVSRFLSGVISTALLGAGWMMALLPAKQTLHDSLSSTETVVVPKAR